MSEEPKFEISRGTEKLGAFTKYELMKEYNSPVKCEGVSVVIEGQEKPLWRAIARWHGARPLEEIIVPPSQLRRIPLAPFVANANEKLKEDE